MKRFKIKHKMWNTECFHFENDLPTWLKCDGAVKGSTMDSSWFLEEYVLKLELGASIDTDFRVITRIE